MTPASFRPDGRPDPTEMLRETLRADPTIVRDDPELLQAQRYCHQLGHRNQTDRADHHGHDRFNQREAAFVIQHW